MFQEHLKRLKVYDEYLRAAISIPTSMPGTSDEENSFCERPSNDFNSKKEKESNVSNWNYWSAEMQFVSFEFYDEGTESR